MNTVYALVDPRTIRIRYIGITSKPPADRLRKHVEEANCGRNLPKYRWMRKLIKNGLEPFLVVLEVDASWDREKVWIARLRATGCSLLNCTDGGEGILNLSEASRIKLIESAKRRRHDPETLRKLRAAKVGRKQPREHVEVRRLTMAVHLEKKAEVMLMQIAEAKSVAEDLYPADVASPAPANGFTGSRHHLATLGERDVLVLRYVRRYTGASAAHLSTVFGFPAPTIEHIISYRTWKHVP